MHTAAADGSEHRRRTRHVFVAHRRLSTAATAASTVAHSSRQQSSASSAGDTADGKETGARDGTPGDTAASPVRSEAAGSVRPGSEAEPQPSAQPGRQLGPASRDFVYEGPLAAPVRRLKARPFSRICGSALATR